VARYGACGHTPSFATRCSTARHRRN